MDTLIPNRLYRSFQLFVLNRWDRLGLATVRMPRWLVTSNVRMAVSRVHPQFLASVERLILDLRDPFLEDPILIQFLWSPGSDELFPMGAIRTLD